jgi:L-malate glycosyltransferase
VREQAKAVSAAGHRVVVLHLAGSTPTRGVMWAMQEELDPSLSEGIEAHHVTHRQFGVRGASYPLYLSSAIAAYRRLRNGGFRPDVIHAHVYGAGIPAALVSKGSGIPLALTEHYSGVAQRSLGRVEARKARYAYNHADRILPVSRFLQESIRSYGVDGTFEIVPNVVDTSVFFRSPESAKTEGSRRLLFVGNLEPLHLKGFPTLLDALGRLRERRHDWRLEVIGDGPERVRHEKAVSDLGLRQHVTFRGSQPKEVVAQTMREADLLVSPSVVETFGAAIAEALVSGLPIVATRVGGIPELVGERSGRLVPSGDPAALARALDDTLEDLDGFDREAIAASATERYSSEVVAERLSEIYASLVARR